MPVKVWRIDRETILRELKEWAQALGERDDVLAVILFGSLARGDYTPASDADVVILLRESLLSFPDRISLFLPDRAGIGVDVFPYTLEEYGRMEGHPGSIREIAEREGIVLFQRERDTDMHG